MDIQSVMFITTSTVGKHFINAYSFRNFTSAENGAKHAAVIIFKTTMALVTTVLLGYHSSNKTS